jgi:uncharacterized protein (TIGR03000 family)
MRYTVLIISLLSITVLSNSANAQFGRRGPLVRALQSMPINPWNAPLIWNNAMRQPNVIIIPQTTPGTAQGTPTTGQSSALNMPQANLPQSMVEIKVSLPVAGAQIKLNGTDMGKVDYFERKFSVPEPDDQNDQEYIVAATWTKDGKEVTQERKVKVNKKGKGIANFLVEQGQ